MKNEKSILKVIKYTSDACCSNMEYIYGIYSNIEVYKKAKSRLKRLQKNSRNSIEIYYSDFYVKFKPEEKVYASRYDEHGDGVLINVFEKEYEALEYVNKSNFYFLEMEEITLNQVHEDIDI